jgi:hypothetical protein
VADDKAEPVALADWLGHWHHYGADGREGDITVTAGKAGALLIEGAANSWLHGRQVTAPSAIKSDVTLTGDRLNFTDQKSGCHMWIQRVGLWLIASDNERCGRGGPYGNAEFGGAYTRMPEAAAAADGVTPIGLFDTGHGSCSDHYYGIVLWRVVETVVGRFYFCGDGTGEVIKQVSYDQKTGHLNFTARRVLGTVPPGTRSVHIRRPPRGDRSDRHA